jgi:EAL domain-containing protein (putative c-di-GMP-specific phosphodiesterase class I)
VRADSVLAQAKFEYRSVYFHQPEYASKILGKDAWRQLINHAIDTGSFDFRLKEVIDSRTGSRRYYAIDVVMQAEDGSSYHYDHFIPPTTQIGLCSRIHHKTLEMLFMKPPHALVGNTCSFKLSMNSLLQREMYEELSVFFETYMANLPFKMIIEIPDRIAAKNLNKIVQYKKLFERFGVDIALYDFIGENEDHHYLEKLHPVYIKGDMDYFLNESDQSLLTLKLITESIGSTIIANNVTDEEAVQKLYEKGIFLTEAEQEPGETAE